MQPLKEKEKNAECLGLTQPGEQKSNGKMVQGRKTGQSSAQSTENTPTPPWNQTHPRKRSPRKQQRMFQERRKFGIFWQRLWLFGGEDFSSFPEENLASLYKSNPSEQECSLQPLQCPGSEQELLNEFKSCWRGNICPQRQQNLCWRYLMWTRSCDLWKEHPSWEQGQAGAEFWEGEVPKALCWLHKNSCFFWFQSAPGMIKLYINIYILYPYKNRYWYTLIWRWGWGKCFIQMSSFLPVKCS